MTPDFTMELDSFSPDVDKSHKILARSFDEGVSIYLKQGDEVIQAIVIGFDFYEDHVAVHMQYTDVYIEA